jgi:hypothetical protein
LDSRLQRKFARAPLKTICLYVDGEHVFKAKSLNISEGGLLLSELPHFPEIKALPLMVSIPQFPKFALLTSDQIKNFETNSVPQKVLKVKSVLVRSYEGESNVDKVFINFVGCEFANIEEEFRLSVVDYIETFTKNCIYLLSLFESLGTKKDQLETLRSVAHLLGYDKGMKVSILRAKVLHDYQSLESI